MTISLFKPKENFDSIVIISGQLLWQYRHYLSTCTYVIRSNLLVCVCVSVLISLCVQVDSLYIFRFSSML